MAANCPKTREVLGGYSQGAAVAGFVTSAAVPPGVPAARRYPRRCRRRSRTMSPRSTLFGTPSDQWLQKYGAPPIAIGPLYQPKTLELCAPGDAICGDGTDAVAHASYAVNGMTGQAADLRRESPVAAGGRAGAESHHARSGHGRYGIRRRVDRQGHRRRGALHPVPGAKSGTAGHVRRQTGRRRVGLRRRGHHRSRLGARRVARLRRRRAQRRLGGNRPASDHRDADARTCRARKTSSASPSSSAWIRSFTCRASPRCFIRAWRR